MSLPLLPGAEAFSADGGPIGVVVAHGFTGAPASMRPWADRLSEEGFSIRLPLLPGHGTSWQDTNRTRWRDWYATIEAAYEDLRERCDQVFGVGLSMGGTLLSKLAEDHPNGVAGLVLVNPAFGTRRFDARVARYLSWVVSSRPGFGSDIKAGGGEGGYDRTPVKAFVSLQDLWRVVTPQLHLITAPILLYTSRVDHVVDSLSAELLRAGATGTSVQQQWLEDSYHVATLDNDAQTIFDGSVDFIRTHSRTSA